MWNKREDDNFQRQAAPPAPPEPKANGSAQYTPQARPAGMAALGASVSIRGDIVSREDLFIGGDVQGSLMLEQHRLMIGPTGKIRANIKAREVAIQGTVQGNVETSDKIVIHKDGSLVGDIKTAGIVIEDGAYFKGSIDITRPVAGKPNAQPVPAGPRPATVQQES